MSIHGFQPTYKSIVSVDPMALVWRQFGECIQSNISRDETDILVAYTREKYNILWLWKLTQAPHSPFLMPVKIKSLIDPYQFIGNYGSCLLKKKKAKLDSYEVGVIRK